MIRKKKIKEESIWAYPLAKRKIKNAILEAISKSKRSPEYVIDRIGYHLVTGESALRRDLNYINEAVDTIKEQGLPISTTLKIFEYVVLFI